jgi:hypothetical protein
MRTTSFSFIWPLVEYHQVLISFHSDLSSIRMGFWVVLTVSYWYFWKKATRDHLFAVSWIFFRLTVTKWSFFDEYCWAARVNLCLISISSFISQAITILCITHFLTISSEFVESEVNSQVFRRVNLNIF